jgi:hypothetical protein
MKTKLFCIWISLLPLTGCAQESFIVKTKYNFSNLAKEIIITFINSSNEEIIINNNNMHGAVPEHSYFELQCLNVKNQVVEDYYFPFGYEPEMKPRFIPIKPHSSVIFRYNLYYRIAKTKNADKIKKVIIQYHIEYRDKQGTVLVYDNIEPPVAL